MLAGPHLQLAAPPGRGRMRAAPSPTPPSHMHSTRHQSTSDEDNNAFEDKEEVRNERFAESRAIAAILAIDAAGGE